MTLPIIDRVNQTILQLHQDDTFESPPWEGLLSELLDSRLTLGRDSLYYKEAVTTAFSLIYELYNVHLMDLPSKTEWQWTAIKRIEQDWEGDAIPEDLFQFLQTQRFK